MFEVMLELCGQAIVGENAISRDCVIGSLKQDLALRNAGTVKKEWGQATMRRTDFVALAIEDRSLVTTGGRALKVRDIEDDPADPLVRFRLGAEHDRA